MGELLALAAAVDVHVLLGRCMHACMHALTDGGWLPDVAHV